MGVLKSFRERQNRAMVLYVAWPLESKEVTFHVKRFASEEMRHARLLAAGDLKLAGVDMTGQDDNRAFMQAFAYHLGKAASRQVCGWTENAPDGDPLEYSEGTAREIFALWNELDFTQLGLGYLSELDEDLKKKEAPTSSDPAS